MKNLIFFKTRTTTEIMKGHLKEHSGTNYYPLRSFNNFKNSQFLLIFLLTKRSNLLFDTLKKFLHFNPSEKAHL